MAAAPQHDIEIQHPCTPALTATNASKRGLHLLQTTKQAERIEARFNEQCRIGIKPLGRANWRAADNGSAHSDSAEGLVQQFHRHADNCTRLSEDGVPLVAADSDQIGMVGLGQAFQSGP